MTLAIHKAIMESIKAKLHKVVIGSVSKLLFGNYGEIKPPPPPPPLSDIYNIVTEIRVLASTDIKFLYCKLLTRLLSIMPKKAHGSNVQHIRMINNI